MTVAILSFSIQMLAWPRASRTNEFKHCKESIFGYILYFNFACVIVFALVFSTLGIFRYFHGKVKLIFWAVWIFLFIGFSLQLVHWKLLKPEIPHVLLMLKRVCPLKIDWVPFKCHVQISWFGWLWSSFFFFFKELSTINIHSHPPSHYFSKMNYLHYFLFNFSR